MSDGLTPDQRRERLAALLRRRRDELRVRPLSFAQRRLWFLDQLVPDGTLYSICFALRLCGPLDVPRLEGCLDAIVARHEVLRTAFDVRDGEPIQKIAGPRPWGLDLVDLRSVPRAEQGDEVRRRARDLRGRPIDLTRGPLARALLLALAGDEHVLVIAIHHIAFDGWSSAILMDELSALYATGPTSLAPLPIQYGDFAAWQHERFGADALAEHLAYWSTKLAGASVLDLPADHARPPVPRHASGRRSIDIDPAVVEGLEIIGREAGATLFATVLTALKILLHRYTGQTDIVVGSPIAGRSRPETEKLIGCFVNSLVLRTSLAGDPTFRDLLSLVRETVLGAFEHEELPFEKLVEALRPERDLSRNPFFEVLYSFQRTADFHAPAPATPRPRDLAVSQLELDSGATRFDLEVCAFRGPAGLHLMINFRADLFEAATIERMLRHLGVLLRGIAQAPDERISALPLLDADERRLLLDTWNETSLSLPAERCVHELFAAQTARTPHALAVTMGTERLTYAELRDRAARLADTLISRGVAPGDLIGVCLDRSPRMVVAVLGVLVAGAAYVPLDPAHPAERIAFMLSDARVRVLLTTTDMVAHLPPHDATVLYLDDPAADPPTTARAPVFAAGPDDAAYVIYTSGSTGRPKGVVVPHRAVVNLLASMRRAPGLEPDDVLLAVTTLSFDISVLEIFLPLIIGARLEVVSREDAADGHALARRLAESGATFLQATPATFRMLLDAGWNGDGRLRAVLGGEAWGWDLASDLLARCGSVWNGYGPTEAAVYASMRAIRPNEGRVDLGGPVGNVTLRVLDARAQPVPIGVPGELYIGGAGVARGYLNQPASTAERFVPDPFSATPGARCYRTGDEVRYRAGGTIEFLGRLDHQIKLRGFRIELGEIESALRQHPAVRDAVVLAREDAPGDKRLVAYVVLTSSGGEGTGTGTGAPIVSTRELRAYLETRLPDYMVPSAHVVLASLPLTPSGKVDRRALPAPETEALAREPYAPPRGPIEAAIAGFFAEVLKVPDVGAHDGFFELGGHSLLATQVTARLRRAFGVELPLRALFEAPSPAELAERVERALGAGARTSAPPLSRVPRDGPVQLSFGQERLWFLDQLTPGDTSYVMPLLLHFDGPADRAALGRVVREIVRRHEVLRTTYATIDGAPAGIVHDEMDAALPVTSLFDLPEAERAAAVAREITAELARPFDLATGPVVRARLLELSVHAHAFLLTMHHIVSDAWTLGIIAAEARALYAAFRAGASSPLAEPAIQHADYAAWQRAWLSPEVLSAELAYWKEHLAGAPHAIDLPADRPRPRVASTRGARRAFALPPELSVALSKLGQREGATLFMVLLAAFDVLLHRYTGQRDLLVGTPVANRTRAETEGVVGFFVNTLVLRTQLSEDETFRALLARVREVCLGAYAHQDMPFERLVQELEPERDLSRSPLFQVMFVLQNAPREAAASPAVTPREVARAALDVELRTSKFDLTLSMAETPRGLVGAIEYATDLFDAATIERTIGHLHVLLAGIARDPDARIGALPLLVEEERRRLLVAWNATERAYPRDRLLHELFEEQASKTPDAPAVVFDGLELPYRELDERANRLANHLRSLGVGPDVLVGVCMERSFELVVALLGVLEAGGAYVPLDPSYPKDRLDFMIADASVKVLLTQERLRGLLPETAATVVALDTEVSLSKASAERPAFATSGASDERGERLAYVIYTSGSTGKPKGAMIPHRAIVNHMRWMAETWPLGAGDAVLQKTPLSFDASVWELYAPLLAGARLVMAEPEGHRDPACLVRTIVENQVTVLQLVPSMLELLLLEPDLERCVSLKRVYCGGEALNRALTERLMARLGAEVVNLYGPTECAIDATYWVCDRGAGTGGLTEPIGRPIANMRAHVLDPTLSPVPIGVPGELCLVGAGVGRGYLGRPELTAERFIADPFAGGGPESRMYRTGDRVRWLASGVLEYLGRVDRQVKIRGYRIELGEIEAAIAEHPAVREVVVIAREGSHQDRRLVAYVVPPGDARPRAADLRAHVKAQLPDYIVPAAFVTLDALPLMPNGKVDRGALPAPDEGAGANEGGRAAPRGPIEEAIAAFFAEVLKVPDVSAHDGFFDLGGHSLLATQVIARLRRAFGVELPLRALFEAPSPAELADRVHRALGAGARTTAPPLSRVPRDGPVQLSFGQERLWFLDQLTPGDTSYAMPLLLELDGPADRAALARVVREIVRRHEVLRTTYATIDGAPAGIVHDEMDAALPVTSLLDLPEAERAAAVAREITAELGRPFDLATGPVVRARLLELSVNTHALLLTMHHIVSDAWSMDILRAEARALYAAFRASAPSPLAEPAIQYADYAAWQRAWLSGEVLAAHLTYWRQQLDGAPRALDLPSNRPRPPVQNHHGRQCSLPLPAELSRALGDLSRREGVTLFMTLLAAFDVVLHRYTGLDDIVVGSPIANRGHAETEGLVGFFVNTLVLRVRLAGELTFSEVLARVKDVCLGAYAHQDMPFEGLVQELAPERDLSRTPLVQVFFNLIRAEAETSDRPNSASPAGASEGAETTAKFDLTLYALEQAGGLRLALVYQTALFEPAQMTSMIEHLREVLEGVTAYPDRPLSDLRLSRPPRRAPPLEIAPRARFVPFTKEATRQTLSARFAEQAERHSTRCAIRTIAGDMSYADLAKRTARVAGALAAQLRHDESRVALLLDHDATMVIGILGALQAGKTYVPLDPRSPAERLAWMIEDAEVSAIVTATSGLPRARELAPSWCVILDMDTLPDAAPPGEIALPETPAYILYTSGSTGRPKGVVQSHGNVLCHIRNYTNALQIDAEDALSLLSTYTFDAAVMDLFGALLNGATLCPIDLDEDGLLHLKEQLSSLGVSIYHSTPTVYRHMMGGLREGEVIPGIRRVVLGGEAVTRRDVACHREHFPPSCVFVNGLGPTESTLALQYFVDRETPLPREGVPVGFPVDGVEVSLMNGTSEQTALYGVGEIVLRSAHVALGYWRRPEATAAAFSEEPSPAGGTRTYRTGDKGRFLPDGSIEFAGRGDDQVKIRGHRVELGEIEARLLMHPRVREAVVVTREDTPDLARLCAYFVADTDSAEPLATSELQRFVRSSLPDWMVPSSYTQLEALPLTRTGKIDRRALPAPEAGAPSAHERVAPRGPIEEAIAGFFAEVLKVPDVGARDGFFELGGHSLLAAQVMARLRRAFGVEVPLRALFEAPTVAELGQRVDEALRSGATTLAPPLVRAARHGPVQLSFGQERLWFLDQLTPGDTSYVMPLLLRLEGSVDRAALQRVVRELCRRHESLRTTYALVDGVLVGIVRDEIDATLAVTSLLDLPDAERPAAVGREITAALRRPFDLAVGPLVRARLLELSVDDQLLLLTMHHIVSDAWTMGIVGAEVRQLYAAFREGKPSPLAEPAIQYADYAAWQRAWLSPEVLSTELAYWREHLAGAPHAIELPLDRPRPRVASMRGARRAFALPAELSHALSKLGQREGATLFMVLLAAFDVLLHRYTGQDDLLVGTPVANRTRAETEGVVGFFVNTLVLRTQLSGDESFRALLARVREVCLGAYAHQDMPFERLVQELEPERDLSRSPLFQVMFVLQNAPRDTAPPPAPEERATAPARLDVEFNTSKFDLSLAMVESPRGLLGSIEYATDLFDAATIDRMTQHFGVLLEAIAAGAEMPLWQLPLLRDDERARLLVEWNDTAEPYPQSACLHHLFEAQVDRAPDATAVVFERERLTYRELDQRTNRLGNHLRALGVGPEVLVGLCVERSAEMLVAILGILKAGGAYVPMDPAYPPERLAFTLEDSRAPVLVTEQRVLPALPAHGARVVSLDGDAAQIAEASDARPASGVGPNDLAYALFTSGSTGRPKGVAIEHHSPVALVSWAKTVYGMDDYRGTLFSTSVCFDLSIFEVFVPLSWGGAVIVAKNALELPSLPAASEVTLINTVPSAMAELLRMDGVPASVRTVNLAGEPLGHALARQIYAVPTIARLLNLYGPTEDTTYSTFAEGKPETWLAPPIGRPIANGAAYVLDAHLQPVPIGVAGELYLGGVGLARGYLHRPELTAERFVESPFGQGRLYKTGDLTRHLADGTLEYVGRIDHQVKVRGFRIELGEIESVLRQHPSVRDAVVTPREDARGDKRLVAHVVLNSRGGEGAGTGTGTGAPIISTRELRAHLEATLPDYMVPSAFVLLGALPLTPNGKIDRKALPAPDADALARAAFTAPRGPVEEAIASLFAEVLQVADVGAHDGFFELGGHSLLATQVTSRIRAAFGVELPLRALFEAPTVAELGGRVDEALRAGVALAAPPLVRVPRRGPVALSFGQERLWFLDQLVPGDTSYVMRLPLLLPGRLDRAALDRALREIERRHEALRTTYALVDGTPVGIVHEHLETPLSVTSLLDLPAEERIAAVGREIAAELLSPFDLAAGPIVRARLLSLSVDAHVLLLTMHHIVSDAWTMGILSAEARELYSAFRDGRPSPLPEPVIQYADYAAWQRAWLSGEVLSQQLAYWKEHLAGAPHAIDLPLDRPRPKVASTRGARRAFALPAELSLALSKLAQREGATLFMTLLAAFDVLLHRHTGQRDLVVGTPVANRTRAEIEGVVGFFVNTLALRTELSDDESFRALLRRVREVCLGAYAHQDMPFERLVQELEPERDLGRTPLFQVMFVMQNAPRRMAAPSEGGRAEARLEVETSASKFDLTLSMAESPRGLLGSIEYATDLFDAATIDRMIGHLRELLSGIAATPDQKVWELPLLPAEERRLQLEVWNAPAAPRRQAACLHQLFEAQAERTPDAIALVSGDVRLTYREVSRRASQIANHLRRHGVGPEVLVGLYLPRSEMIVVAILGILRAGGAYLPLDPSYPKDRLAFMIEDSGVRVVVSLAELASTALPRVAATILLDRDRDAIAREPVESPASEVKPDGLAYVIYTSGSTGKPKGVMVTHANVARLFASTEAFYRFDASDVWTMFHSYAFDFSVWEIWGALLYGGRLVVVPYDVSRTPESFHRLLRDERVTVVNQTPQAFRQLVHAEQQMAAPGALALRYVIFGGEALDVAELRPWWERHGDTTPELVNMYGITETTVHVTHRPLGIADLDRPWSSVIGRPIPDLQVYVLDPRLSPAPVGVSGEIYVGGAGVARGYLNRPELTEARFVASPFTPGERLYRTGDLARFLPNGDLEYLGRIDHQVKIRGYRIELGEIESVLAQHPAVRAAVVLARRDDPAASLALVAYVVAAAGAAPAVPELREFLKEKLPDFMVPSAFVALDDLPLTANGKVDRAALPAPDSAARAARGYVSPRTSAEESLASIYAEVLGLPKVGIRDDFFDLGGHSMLAVRLFWRIEKVFGTKLPLATLFSAPSPAELAAVLSEVPGAVPRSILSMNPMNGEKPPLFWCGFNFTELTRLSKQLSDQPLFHLQSGYFDVQNPTTHIRDLAARYVRDVRVVQPEGPYYLGGSCIDGFVAFEMALQLEAQGQKVALLALVEREGPDPMFVRYTTVRGALYRFRHHRRNLARLGAAEQRAYVTELWRRFQKRVVATFVGRDEYEKTVLAHGEEDFVQLAFAALRSYTPNGRFTTGRAALIFGNVTARHLPLTLFPKVGWARAISGPLAFHVVPGDHEGVASAEHVPVLADRIRACLDEARADAGK